MSEKNDLVQVLIELFDGLIDGSINREEAQMRLPVYPRTHAQIMVPSSLYDEAYYVIKGAGMSEADFFSDGEPYFYRTEDFAEWRAVLRNEDSTATNAEGVQYLRYHQMRPIYSHPVAMFTVSMGEFARRLNLPHIRGIDGLDYTKTMVLLTPDNRQYMFMQHVRSPQSPYINLYIENTVEDDAAEIAHVMHSLQIDQKELYWRTSGYQEHRKQIARDKQRKDSQS